MIPPPPRSALFPYTTRFRSRDHDSAVGLEMPHREREDGCGQGARQEEGLEPRGGREGCGVPGDDLGVDRKSTRLDSSHVRISYAVFCLKKKKKKKTEKSQMN